MTRFTRSPRRQALPSVALVRRPSPLAWGSSATEEGTVEQHVSWVIELTVKDGALDSFKELMAEMVAGTNEEPQTLAYEWYISDDQRTVHIFEKYADSSSMVSHVQGFLAKWAARFTQCVDADRFVVYGNPSEEARQILAGFNPTYLGPWGGFSRFS